MGGGAKSHKCSCNAHRDICKFAFRPKHLEFITAVDGQDFKHIICPHKLLHFVSVEHDSEIIQAMGADE